MDAAAMTELSKLEVDEDTLWGLRELEDSTYIITSRALAGVMTGLMPQTEENDGTIVFYDFPALQAPIRGSLKNRVYNRALLFTGEPGSGKHTAEMMVARVLFGQFEEIWDDHPEVHGEAEFRDLFRCYCFDGAAIAWMSGKEMREVIGSLFDQLKKTVEENSDVMIVMTLGDLTDILDKKKTRRYLLSRVNEILEMQEGLCVITGCFDGSAGELDPGVGRSFEVYELENPDRAARVSFFVQMLDPEDPGFGEFRNIVMERTIGELADATDGFTFGMLEEVKRMILRTVRGKLVKDSVNWDETEESVMNRFVWLNTERKITVTADEADAAVRNAKALRRQPAAGIVPVFGGIAAAGVPAAPGAAPVAEAPQQQTNDQEGQTKDDAVRKLSSDLNNTISFKAREEAKSRLIRATSYVPDNFEEGLKKIEEERPARETLDEDQ